MLLHRIRLFLPAGRQGSQRGTGGHSLSRTGQHTGRPRHGPEAAAVSSVGIFAVFGRFGGCVRILFRLEGVGLRARTEPHTIR